jgi:hypothetical protein
VAGIIAAFQRRRELAIWRGAVAGAPGLLFFAFLGIKLFLEAPAHRISLYFDLMWMAVVSLATAFWAMLLAFLIPEK